MNEVEIKNKLNYAGFPLSCTLEGWESFSNSKNIILEKMLTRFCILANDLFYIS